MDSIVSVFSPFIILWIHFVALIRVIVFSLIQSSLRFAQTSTATVEESNPQVERLKKFSIYRWVRRIYPCVENTYIMPPVRFQVMLCIHVSLIWPLRVCCAVHKCVYCKIPSLKSLSPPNTEMLTQVHNFEQYLPFQCVNH